MAVWTFIIAKLCLTLVIQACELRKAIAILFPNETTV